MIVNTSCGTLIDEMLKKTTQIENMAKAQNPLETPPKKRAATGAPGKQSAKRPKAKASVE